jgi:hypothetical protein
MEGVGQELVNLLKYLLPGFVAAWIFYGLTSHQKPSQFERVVQALIFTLFVQAMLTMISAIMTAIGGKWGDAANLITSTLLAILIGFIFSYFTNNDKFHALIRRFDITRETSFPSEWFGAFLDNETYVVLHLKDERRIYGWPTEWPSDQSKGHFVLEEPVWLNDEGQTLLKGVKTILINVGEVMWVEFMERQEEKGRE